MNTAALTLEGQAALIRLILLDRIDQQVRLVRLLRGISERNALRWGWRG